MANVKYYPEDVLVEKFLVVNEESAEEFVDWKGEKIEAGE